MVDAALRATREKTLPIQYESDDEGKMETLNALNLYEAGEEYAWPDFSSLGYDFVQTMRLRFSLIEDVFTALVKTGDIVVRLEAPVTPGSAADGKKRLCIEGLSLMSPSSIQSDLS